MSTNRKRDKFTHYRKGGSYIKSTTIISRIRDKDILYGIHSSEDERKAKVTVHYSDDWVRASDHPAFKELIAREKAKDQALRHELKAFDEMLSKADALVESQQQILAHRAPGHRAIGILQAVLPKSVFDRIYGQMVADAREEYYEAVAQGNMDEAKKIARYLNWSLISSVFAFFAGLPAHLLSLPFKAFKKEDE